MTAFPQLDFPGAKHRVELSPVKAGGSLVSTMFSSDVPALQKRHLFRVWALNAIPGGTPSSTVSHVYLHGPIPAGPWALGSLEAALRQKTRAFYLGKIPDTRTSAGERFYLARPELEQILSEARSACFEHEDCRENLALGAACRAQRTARHPHNLRR